MHSSNAKPSINKRIGFRTAWSNSLRYFELFDSLFNLFGNIGNTRSPPGDLLTVAQRRLLVLDAQTGLREEGSNQLGPLPEAADREDQLLVQLLQVPAHQVAHLDIFQMMPTPLVPRVQVR